MGFPTDESRISEAERELGLTLPRELRQRLLRNNGGEILAGGDPWELHPVWDPSDHKRASRSANHIVKETQNARRWEAFPRDAVVVASDGTGDFLIIRPGVAQIQIWLHETGEVANIDIEWED
jgi:SMI1 / KNR4 family (SUKH-1)